jgi:hypothetical protein
MIKSTREGYSKYVYLEQRLYMPFQMVNNLFKSIVYDGNCFLYFAEY